LLQVIIEPLFVLDQEKFTNEPLVSKLKVRLDINGLRQPIKIGMSHFCEGNWNAKAILDRVKRILTVFGMEDEATIKLK
jgi:hypothetical protein